MRPGEAWRLIFALQSETPVNLSKKTWDVTSIRGVVLLIDIEDTTREYADLFGEVVDEEPKVYILRPVDYEQARKLMFKLTH